MSRGFRTGTLIFTGFLVVFITLSSHADLVRTHDGSVLQGKVLQMSEGKLVLETSFAGKIEIPWNQITQIETEKVEAIHLEDGSIIQGTLTSPEPGEIRVRWGVSDTVLSVTPEQVAALAPPPPPSPTPVKWTGRIVGSAAVTDGNTETASVSITGDMSRRSEKDRIRLRAGIFYEEADDKETRNDRFASGQYDYFFHKRLYGYLNTRLERDNKRDLDLRVSVGAGLGYQWLEEERYNLSSELGASYVKEDFGDDKFDDSYTAGRAAMHFDWWIVKQQLQFLQDAEVLMSFEGSEDWLLTTLSELRWHWTSRWFLNASVRLNYDNSPVPGKEKEDWIYTLGIGYSF